MGFRGGVKLTPPQHILVFKYPSRDRVKDVISSYPLFKGWLVRFVKVPFRILTGNNERNIVEFPSSKGFNSDIVLHRFLCFIFAIPIYRETTFENILFPNKKNSISHSFYK